MQIKNFINTITKLRPEADHGIEQYLMTGSGLYKQINLTKDYLKNKKIIFIGDDDHYSLVVSRNIPNTFCSVLEIDNRIIESQRLIAKDFNIKNHEILKYDVSHEINNLNTKHNKYDGFMINPPYGSKNEGYGSLIWLSRSLSLTKVGGIGLIILPIDTNIEWTTKNMLSIQKFLLSNGCVILDIDKDVHSYYDVPNFRSSNIWIYKQQEAMMLIGNADKNLYR